MATVYASPRHSRDDEGDVERLEELKRVSARRVAQHPDIEQDEVEAVESFELPAADPSNESFVIVPESGKLGVSGISRLRGREARSAPSAPPPPGRPGARSPGRLWHGVRCRLGRFLLDLGHPLVQPFPYLLRGQLSAAALVAGDHNAGGGDPGQAGQAENLPQFHERSPLVADAVLSLEAAVNLTRTGDLWLFRGRSPADHAIRVVTNAPVNHVGMAVVLGELPPLMWHAELGKGLPDVWTGSTHRGVQLHDLRAAVQQWAHRYGQRAWLRQLDAPVTRQMEDALLRSIARLDGTPFPATAALAGRWARGRIRRAAPAEFTYCAEVVAATYQAMGLLGDRLPTNFYDPGSFWSGDRLMLAGGARLGAEIRVDVPAPPLDRPRRRRWGLRLPVRH